MFLFSTTAFYSGFSLYYTLFLNNIEQHHSIEQISFCLFTFRRNELFNVYSNLFQLPSYDKTGTKC